MVVCCGVCLAAVCFILQNWGRGGGSGCNSGVGKGKRGGGRAGGILGRCSAYGAHAVELLAAKVSAVRVHARVHASSSAAESGGGERQRRAIYIPLKNLNFDWEGVY